MWPEYYSKMFFVVNVIDVEMKEHFCTRNSGDAGADDALDLRKDIEEFWARMRVQGCVDRN